MKKYIRKNVPFDPENEQERELHAWLQKLPHGRWSEDTKAYWLKKMRKEKRDESKGTD